MRSVKVHFNRPFLVRNESFIKKESYMEGDEYISILKYPPIFWCHRSEPSKYKLSKLYINIKVKKCQ